MKTRIVPSNELDARDLRASAYVHRNGGSITTTDGTVFTPIESLDMARLVFKRFGHDLSEATAAWRRLLQNDCSEAEFQALVMEPTHTPHCEGHCQYHGEDD